ncbi:hypothetical protein HDV00_004023 [Rhizophlyctis rosea]|nr:hypothetical protein HDV00_004023 [Rhizophlyctis rosea]
MASYEDDGGVVSASQDMHTATTDIGNDIAGTHSQKRSHPLESEDDTQSKRLRQSTPTKSTDQTPYTSHQRERTILNKPILTQSEFENELRTFHLYQSKLCDSRFHSTPIPFNHVTILDRVEYNPLRVCLREMGVSELVYANMSEDLERVVEMDCGRLVEAGLLEWVETGGRVSMYRLPKDVEGRLRK